MSGMISHAQRIPVFTPDRTYFADKCGQIVKFNQEGQQAIPSNSKTTLSPRMKDVIGQFFDYWQVKGDGDQRKLAYIVATAFRESDYTFQPLREVPNCRSNEACRQAAIAKLLASRAKPGKPLEENYAAPAANGKRYYGRGYIQLTGANNYKSVGEKLGMGSALYDDPDQVLKPEIALRILMSGMLEGDYWGGSHPLSLYFNKEHADWLNARNSVNPGSPHKPITAALGKEFNDCLRPMSANPSH